MSIISKVLLLIISILQTVSVASAAEQIRVAYLATKRPYEAVESLRPVLNGVESEMSRHGARLRIKSEVVRRREQLDLLIKKKSIHLIRCEAVYCMGLLQKFPELQLLASEAPASSSTETYHFVSLKGKSDIKSANTRSKKLMFGAMHASGEDLLLKVLLVREGYKKESFETVFYEEDQDKRVLALQKGEADFTVVDEKIFSKHEKDLDKIWSWESIPYVWISTPLLSKQQLELFRERLPFVNGESIRFITHHMPDFLKVTEAWHVSGLFNEGKVQLIHE